MRAPHPRSQGASGWEAKPKSLMERALRRSRMSDEELLLLESSRVDEAMIEALAADAGGVFRLPLAQTAAQYVEEVRANAQYVVNERARHETVLGWQGGAETQQVRR